MNEPFRYVNRPGEGSVTKETAPRRSIGARQNPEAEAAILDAAEALLAEKGLKGLSMDAVARRAHASKATIYRWWPSRGALLLAVYARFKSGYIHPDTGDVLSDVTAFYTRLFDYWRGPARIFALIIAEAQQDEDVAQALDRYRGERHLALSAVIARALPRGELRPGADPGVIAESLQAHSWNCLLTGRLDTDPVALARQVLGPWLL